MKLEIRWLLFNIIEIKLYNTSGKISGTATANEGKLDGVAKLFDENGNTVEEVIYKDNKVVKRIK